MITPDRAQRLIARHARTLDVRAVPILASLGSVLAEDVRAPFPFPRFDNSAMDGYAVRSRDTAGASGVAPVRLALQQTVFAGDTAPALPPGRACGIMTGAPMPHGADAVVRKEDAVVDGGDLVVRAEVPRCRHVRRRGEEVAKGRRVLKAGAVIHPGTIAVLASVGKDRVRVVRRPVVSVIATGDELVPPGRPLKAGRIYESNSAMVAAMLGQLGITKVHVRRVKDRPRVLAQAVGAALDTSDVLIVLGGVSVGDRDYLRSVLHELEVDEVFWRIRQKPGKPMYFGVRSGCLVFGLPGNPSSAFSCFYGYVYAAIRRLSGFAEPDLPYGAPVRGEIQPHSEKWSWLKARRSLSDDAETKILDLQGSHTITSLAETDRLVVVPPAAPGEKPQSAFATHILPHGKAGDR